MLDQLYGKPSTSWRRSQVFLVLLFWALRLAKGDPRGPPLPFIRRLNRALARFTPWQTVVGTLTLLYAVRHTDCVMGLQAPEPLARLYARNYYRATWIVTAFDAGFATAMNIQPKWIRDILSIAFTGYYLLFASEADEKLRKYRAMCTVEMLRVTWEKTSNPYVRWFTSKDRPRITIKRKQLLPRPKGSPYTKPMTIFLYFHGTDAELAEQTELVFDLPGGGFICMSPEHHEERLIRWAIRTGRPVLSMDYGKAPEYPYPFAIDEAFDCYKLLHESKAKCIGLKGSQLGVVLSGDSAGANIATAMLIKLLETKGNQLPQPVALVFAYPALSFHFTSWMPPSDIRVLRQESHHDVAGLIRGKEHHEHRSPLAVVEEDRTQRPRRSRTRSWGSSLARGVGISPGRADGDEDEEEERDEDKSLSERIVWWDEASQQKQEELQAAKDSIGREMVLAATKTPMETRLAMTSRTAFFNDRIISPPMCRAMALLYIGPRNVPDLHSDYHISPIFTPAHLLHQFPPVYLSCGERDPFVDDTVIFAGKLREAKEARRVELLAKESKFGEGLRMSGPSSAREAILDEIESDWIEMRLIDGWSHGYLQMLPLLPEAETTILMMADWINKAFEKHNDKLRPTRPAILARQSSPLPASPIPTRSTSTTHVDSQADLDEIEAGEADDDVLSFTPRKRAGTLSPSPSNTATGGVPTLGQPAGSSTTRGRSGSSLKHDTTSSDESAFGPDPCTPPEFAHLGPAPLSLPHSSEGQEGPVSPTRLKAHLAPHERLLREEISTSLSAVGNGTSPATRRSQSLDTKPASNRRAHSDEETPSTKFLAVDDNSIRGGKARTGSAGQLTPANFVDAKDLLKRRRDVAVFGLSNTNSAVASDEEGSGEDKGKAGR